MKRRHPPGHPSGPSQRLLRVGEVVRHVLADIFVRGDLQDKELQGARLTVSEVRVSPDMRRATVFVARLGGGEMGEILKALARARGYLRSRVGHELTTRFTPDLSFEEDRSFDEAQHIAQILHSPEVAADLQSKEDEDGTPQ
jgi:ribosome-binding factor A